MRVGHQATKTAPSQLDLNARHTLPRVFRFLKSSVTGFQNPQAEGVSSAKGRAQIQVKKKKIVPESIVFHTLKIVTRSDSRSEPLSLSLSLSEREREREMEMESLDALAVVFAVPIPNVVLTKWCSRRCVGCLAPRYMA